MVEATSFATNIAFEGTPEVTQIEYDVWVLRITLQFPNRHAPVYVEFERVAGLRVLDEGQLSSFWSATPRPTSWLWQIASGGWLALESTRQDFLLASTADCTLQEFLVCGENECVNILTYTAPRAYAAAP
jgi:hypothetical protein